MRLPWQKPVEEDWYAQEYNEKIKAIPAVGKVRSTSAQANLYNHLNEKQRDAYNVEIAKNRAKPLPYGRESIQEQHERVECDQEENKSIGNEPSQKFGDIRCLGFCHQNFLVSVCVRAGDCLSLALAHLAQNPAL